jgi:nucleotide-binding universal stress UspA family protein
MRDAIMVPLDGTRLAEAALPAAIHLARRDDRAIMLVTVWQPALPLYDTGWVHQWESERRAERYMYMSSISRKVEEASGKPVSVEYLDGRPGDILPPLPAAKGIGLVVMATHGRGAIARASLGSVADQMVRKGTAPVLLIRPDEAEPEVKIEAGGPFRRILVPLDGSDVSEKALQKSMLIGSERAEITLLRVLAFPLPFVATDAGIAIPVNPEVVRAEKEAAQAYLDRVAERLASGSCKVTTRVLEDASPWTGVVKFAEANDFDLIAMATHGRGGAARMLLGSVADRVIRSATVPVMLFHPERSPSPWKELERLAGQVAGMP